MKLTWLQLRLQYYLPRLGLAAYDTAAVFSALVLAVVLRYDAVPPGMLHEHFISLPIVLLTYVLTYYFFHLYSAHWRYASVEMLWSVLLANMLATGMSIVWQSYLDDQRLPLAVWVITALLATAMIGGQRMMVRLLATASRRDGERARGPWDDEPRRALVLGSGQSAAEVISALAKEGAGRYEIIGILEDESRYHGSYLRGVRIIGPTALLHELLHKHEMDEVIIALPQASSAQLREYVLACCRHKVAVRVVPVIAELLENPSMAARRLRAHGVTVEDLLQRAPIDASLQQVEPYFTGKRVLVTGAGGSIGSELCRQIARMNPALLVLLGHGENSIHDIYIELRHAMPELTGSIVTVICDIRDAERLHWLVGNFRPQVLLHAAAHKHVPLMEDNVPEAVTNNVGGTRNVIRAAMAHHVERMVLVSTDKAVNPSSVMGATKFLCEEQVNAAWRQSDTTFVTVRFGNVLGSRGSVLPLFQEQIIHGGPLTVTHPEMTRYFMTIPEAASLVLQACAMGESGQLFVLDMGRPVRILDLAENVIRLSGLEPYQDIGIEFCGLRPGEKLHEELFTSPEQQQARTLGRMFVVDRPQYIDAEQLPAVIDGLLAAAHERDARDVLEELRVAVPTFRQPEMTTADVPSIG